MILTTIETNCKAVYKAILNQLDIDLLTIETLNRADGSPFDNYKEESDLLHENAPKIKKSHI